MVTGRDTSAGGRLEGLHRRASRTPQLGAQSLGGQEPGETVTGQQGRKVKRLDGEGGSSESRRAWRLEGQQQRHKNQLLPSLEESGERLSHGASLWPHLPHGSARPCVPST